MAADRTNRRGLRCGLADSALMDPEVIAALIGTPAVLVTAATGWLAGRAQSRGAYHGPVDAIRRTAQREAYADLYRSARRFIYAWEEAETALDRIPAHHNGAQPLPEELREMHEAQDLLEHAVDMVRLEGPDSLAEIADRIWDSATTLGGGIACRRRHAQEVRSDATSPQSSRTCAETKR